MIFEIRSVLTEILQIFWPGFTLSLKFNKNTNYSHSSEIVTKETKFFLWGFPKHHPPNRQNTREIEAMFAKK